MPTLTLTPKQNLEQENTGMGKEHFAVALAIVAAFIVARIINNFVPVTTIL
jgi:hypothetical protein